MPEDKFDKPLGKWIEEDIDTTVMIPHISEDGKRLEKVESKVVKARQKTMYVKEEVAFKSCNNHFWELKDNNLCKFECSRCGMGCIARPTEYSWLDGKLTKLQ